MSCATLETIAAWALGELPEAESEAFEAHYFGCDRCFQRAAGVDRVLTQLRTSLPPALTAARHEALRAAQPEMPTVHVRPGEQATIRLGAGVPVGVWVMHCELHGVSRLDLEARSLTGEPLFAFADVPFDDERGEVLMPCHVHYRSLEMDSSFVTRLLQHEAGTSRILAEYRLNHEFEESV
jgi:hypothetical protein